MKELSIYETIEAITKAKKYFESEFEKRLGLIKVQSPLFVRSDTGLQDYLSGVEKSVSFTKGEETFEIVHSLAKWKREALYKYGFKMHTGLYTEMKAIRKEEVVDSTHSLFVEQWDWEKVISAEDRTIDYLQDTVRSIYDSLKATLEKMKKEYEVDFKLPEDITFITSEELVCLYPGLTPKEREELITKKCGAVFIIGIGGKLSTGEVHDLRSPDYDDWSLDGDLLVYSDVLDKAVELSSMGIRVDEKSLLKQLELSDTLDRLKCPYHQMIMKKEYPLTIGGGIGISRVLLLLLGKEHIAEVQASSWQEETICKLKLKKML